MADIRKDLLERRDRSVRKNGSPPVGFLVIFIVVENGDVAMTLEIFTNLA